MTGWIIAAAVFGFFALILGTSAKCRLSYQDGEFCVKVGFWCFWFTVFPQQKKEKPPEKQPEKKADSDKPPKEEPEKKKEKTDFSLIRNLIGSGLKGFQTVWRHLIFYNLRLRVVVGDEDAAACALQYGKLCGAVYGGLAAAKNLARLREKEISLSCDFSKNRTECDLQAFVRIRILFVFGAAFRMLFHLAVNTMKNG